jgi:hypothetical protein
MGRKILAMSLVLVMALSFTACGGDGLPSAQDIVDGAVQAVDNIRTCECEMDANMNMIGEAEGETSEMNTEMDYNGTLDLDNRQMRIEIAVTTLMPWLAAEEMEIAMGAYLIDDAGYTMTDSPETAPEWEKEEFSEADWAEIWGQGIGMMSPVWSQLELLGTSEVEVIGSEEVKGIDCYVLQVTPANMAQLWETGIQEITLGLGGVLEFLRFSEEILDSASISFSVKHWVAQDTYFLMKAEIDMAIELTAEDLGYPEEEMEMSIALAMNISMDNYNQPVSIELPPEAAEALGY